MYEVYMMCAYECVWCVCVSMGTCLSCECMDEKTFWSAFFLFSMGFGVKFRPSGLLGKCLYWLNQTVFKSPALRPPQNFSQFGYLNKDRIPKIIQRDLCEQTASWMYTF